MKTLFSSNYWKKKWQKLYIGLPGRFPTPTVTWKGKNREYDQLNFITAHGFGFNWWTVIGLLRGLSMISVI